MAGQLCQISGAGLAAIGGAITVGSVLNGGGLAGLLVGGSATVALALAGAPIAALGSIANSQKASRELLALHISENMSPPAMDLPLEGWKRLGPEYGETSYSKEPAAGGQLGDTGAADNSSMPPPPPPPPRE